MPAPEANVPARGRSRRWLLSIRGSLLLSFGLILLLIGLGIGFNNLRVGRRIQQRFLTRFIEQTGDLTEAKTESFFQPAARLCAMLGLQAGSGLLTQADPAALVRAVDPLLRDLPAVSSLNFGARDGWGLMVKGDGTNWLTRESGQAGDAGAVTWSRWSPDGTLMARWTEQLDYDVRRRPWFTNALRVLAEHASEPGRRLPPVAWTPPYAFHAGGEPGLTASVAVPLGQTNLAVIASDVLLRDLDEFTRAHPPTPNGWTLLLNDDNRIVGLPETPAGAATAGERPLVTEVPNPRLAEVARAWIDQGRPADFLAEATADGEDYWFSARPIHVPGARFWALLIIPETDVMADIVRERKVLAAVLAGVFLLAIGLALVLASAYSRPLRALVRRSEAIRQLDLRQPRRGRSHIREVDQLFQAQAAMGNALTSFSRYVPVAVLRELLKRGEAAKLGARPAELTVLFSDIRGFTGISEQVEPDQLARWLGEYFGALQKIIEAHRGTTDKFIGDAVLAFWGAPADDPRHAFHATRAVLECRATLARLNDAWETAGRPRLDTCFGLATGRVVVGNVGAPTRMNYTVLGDAVNVASRLEGLCRRTACDALATAEVVRAAGPEVVWRRVGPVAVKGKRAALEVFEPLGLKDALDTGALDFKRAYESALENFLRRDFTLAEVGLSPWLKTQPAARLLAARCQALAEAPENAGPLLLVGGDA